MSATLSVRSSEQLRAYSRASLWAIALCFILSGATGLIYEVLWARMLGLVFGATTFAISTVLAAFMGGLALGSALAGKFAASIKRPLRAYGLIEIGIALYALIVPLLFRFIDDVYALVWEQFHPGFYAFSLWRFLLSCAVLLVPTTLMGATLPILSAALLRSPAHASNSVARLYTCNLIGAILGTIAAGFLLLPEFGVQATIWTAATVNLVIGIAACLLDRKDAQAALTNDEAMDQAVVAKERHAIETTKIKEPSEREEITGQQTVEPEIQSTKFWLLCAAVSGFVTISAQVAWTRVLTMVIGSSTYAFSIVVALFLLGLSGGAYLMSRRKISTHLRRTILKVELATAAGLALSIWIINRAPSILINLGLSLSINSWSGWLMLQTFVAALLVLVPALLMGMVMPLVLMWASDAGREGLSVRLVGRSYAVNTVGAILGAFSTGFILIPKASTRFTILFAATLCIVIAGIAYQPLRDKADVDLRRSLAAGATLALIIALFMLMPPLNLADLSKGAYDGLLSVLARPQMSEGEEMSKKYSRETNRLLMYKEGPTATVSVREDWGTRSLAINGRTNASDQGDMPTQVMVGLLPLLIAPNINDGLIVGYASGVSVGSMLQSPIKSLACVELEPTTLEAGRYFEHVNHRPLQDPRLRMIIDDARTYLRVNPAQYDVIVSEPSHPWVPGVANLFTKEFFELGRSRLKDDGVFVQWVQIYQLSTESLRSVLATYQSVFPHVMMFRVGGASKGKDLILLGSRRPLTFAQLGERISEPRISAELARVDMKEQRDIESWYVCDETQLSPAVAGAVINTDDNMRIENRVPREAFLPFMDSNAVWIETLAAAARQAKSLRALTSRRE